MNEYDLIIKEKSHCYLYNIDNSKQGDPDGWIGGSAPSIFNDSSHSELNDHEFYLTFLLPFKNKQISIFIPDYDTYLDHRIYPDCSIKVIEHDICMNESENDTFKSTNIQRRNFYKDKYCTEKESREERFFVKFGGEPVLIQNKDHYYEELEKDGFDFLIQIDEYGYPVNDDFIKTYPFSFGAVYLYAKITDEINSIIAGYWQYS